MRLTSFARNRFATHDFQAGFLREVAQAIDREPEIAVIERIHRRAMRVLRKRCGKQSSAGLERARGFGECLGRMLAVGECVHQQNQIETPRADV